MESSFNLTPKFFSNPKKKLSMEMWEYTSKFSYEISIVSEEWQVVSLTGLENECVFHVYTGK